MATSTKEQAVSLSQRALIPTFIAVALISTVADAQRAGVSDRRPRPLTTVPAVENYAPAAAGIFEVVSVQASDRVARLRASDGRALEVSVAEYVYDLSKLKAGDKLKVDFFQLDEANPKVSAAGIWPVEAR
jgi:hypothetical protein